MMSVRSAAPAVGPVTPSSGRFRPEIEGLRAIAFVLVAVYHVWLDRVSGGVDVFFAVAGFLITITLMGHLRRYSTIRAGVYLSRLAVRLIPPAAVVLLVTAVGIVTLLPFAEWGDRFLQIGAAATYWENWHLAFNSVDYLATDQSRSPVQHFWALSIQGQFYLIWLVVFIVAAAIAKKAGRSPARFLLTAVLVLVVTSFGWSVYQTNVDQQFAYFNTLTRVWEFGLGSLLALTIDKIRLPRFVSGLVSWIALASIVFIGVTLTVGDLFPGGIALVPVLSALAIIVGGNNPAPWGAQTVLGSRPMVWLGGLGYGVYLWHWPLLIFALEWQGRSSAGPKTGLAVLVLSVALAVVTKRLIERPFMLARAHRHRRGRLAAVAVALSGALVVSSVATGGVLYSSAKIEQQNQELWQAFDDECFGAGSLDPLLSCDPDDPDDPDAGVHPAVPEDDSAAIFDDECLTNVKESSFKPCTWGNPESDVRVALIGNSHGAVWFPALLRIVEMYGWRLDTYFKGACSFNTAERQEGQDLIRTTCADWNRALIDHLDQNEAYSYVLTSSIAQNSRFIDDATGEVSRAAGIEGYREAWQTLTDRGATVFVVRDYPRMDERALECALSTPHEGCGRLQTEALILPAEELIAQAAADAEGVELIDMTAWFCSEGFCPSVIGGVRVYRDVAHFTNTYGETLAPALLRELQHQGGFPEVR